MSKRHHATDSKRGKESSDPSNVGPGAGTADREGGSPRAPSVQRGTQGMDNGTRDRGHQDRAHQRDDETTGGGDWDDSN